MLEENLTGLYLENKSFIPEFKTEQLFEEINQTTCQNAKRELMEKIMLNNMGLVHYTLRRRFSSLKKSMSDMKITYDDLFSIGCYGLWKAIIKFKVENNFKFVTFASIVISNEFGIFLRNNLKYGKDYSLQFVINDNQQEDSRHTELMDLIAIESDFITPIINDEIMGSLPEFLGKLNERDQQIFLLAFVYEKKQKEISKHVGISQSYVSRIIKELSKKALKEYKNYSVS